jgi:hypothetical protein
MTTIKDNPAYFIVITDDEGYATGKIIEVAGGATMTTMKDNPAIIDTILSVINDENGALCGLTHKERCQHAEYGLFYFRAACARYSEYRKRHGERELTRQELIEAAAQIQNYYRNHMLETQRLMKMEGQP